MTKECKNLVHVMRDTARWQDRSVDQDHGQAKCAGRVELRARAGSAGILRDDEIDPVLDQERPVLVLAERSTRDHRLGIPKGKGQVRRIDQPQKIVVLRLDGERAEILPPDGKEDTRGRLRKRIGGRSEGWNMRPLVPQAGAPGCALEGAKRDVRDLAGDQGVAADFGREGMCRIDDMGNALRAQVAGKAVGATKSSDPGWQGLPDRRRGAPGIGKARIHTTIGKAGRKLACLAGSAQKKDTRHG